MTFNIKEYDEEDQARMEEFGKWKTCSKCGVSMPRSWTEFHRDKAIKEGLRGQCKACKAEYRKENKDYFREYYKEYYKENKDYFREYEERYRKENKEAIAERKVEYNERYYKENIIYYKEYYKENKEAITEYIAEYNRNNPEIMRRVNQRRRARLAELPHTLTIEEWEDSLSYFNDSCSYCGEHQDDLEHTLHQEHVIPVSKGGGYIKENIIPACQPCNSSKNARDMEEWYREQPFFTEAQLHKIKEWQKDSE